ncbi:MAG: hypothetical protein ACRDND_33820 [Streptosporangiaceae bacterium]
MAVYFTDRASRSSAGGGARTGDAGPAARLQAFAGLHPESGVPGGRRACWVARADEDDEL